MYPRIIGPFLTWLKVSQVFLLLQTYLRHLGDVQQIPNPTATARQLEKTNSEKR